MTYEPPSPPDPYWQQAEPSGPGGGPQMPPFLIPAAPPRRRNRLWLIVGICAGVLVLCCGGLAALGAIVGPPKNTASVTADGHTATASASKPGVSPASSPTRPPSPSPLKAPSQAPSPTSKPASPNYAAAAAILLADDEHYRQEIAAGPPLLDSPAFTPWWQKTSTDTQDMDDFGKADAYFTADNEPTDVIEAWRTDNGNAVTDVYQFAAAELAARGGPGPTDDMHKWEVAFQADIAKADLDAQKLGAMH